MPQALHGNRLPSLTQQARNLAAAATRTFRAIIKNEPVFVPVAVREQRQALCAACDYNLNGRCRLCGCCVKSQIFRKTQLAAEECPLNPPKWLKML